MGIKLTNNANATIAASINSSATSITLTSGQGARFPTLSAGDYFYATLIDTSNNLEIVKCTARSTDVLTVVRAQESTTARAYTTGDRIEIRLTAQTFLDATNFTPTPAGVSDQNNTSTGYFDLPVGTTAERPGSPVNGMIRYNSTLGKLEVYEGGAWVSYSTNYAIEYLIVAGGGGGAGGFGGIGGGGGGAGGYIDGVGNTNSGATFAITIGAGGSGAGGSSGTLAALGTNTSFSSTSAIGGGGAASYNGGSSQSGGSGGGGTYSTQPAGAGTTGQGFAGGAGSASPSGYGGGGGGGALNQGVAGSGAAGGAGGAGINWKSIGTFYADGGGGGVCNNITASVGGSGTGGAGASGGPTGGTSANGGNATANRGSGGGGGANNGGNGGNGSGGIVIVRYLGAQRGTGGTVTSSGGYTYHTFTGSGTYTA